MEQKKWKWQKTHSSASAHIEYYTPRVKSHTLCKTIMSTGMGLGMTQQLHLEIWVNPVQRLYPDVIWVLWQYSVVWFRDGSAVWVGIGLIIPTGYGSAIIWVISASIPRWLDGYQVSTRSADSKGSNCCQNENGHFKADTESHSFRLVSEFHNMDLLQMVALYSLDE